MCAVCGETPCNWIVYGDDIISETELMYEEDPQKEEGEVENRFIRKLVYKYYIYEKHGFLGKGNRIRTPLCVLIA